MLAQEDETAMSDAANDAELRELADDLPDDRTQLRNADALPEQCHVREPFGDDAAEIRLAEPNDLRIEL